MGIVVHETNLKELVRISRFLCILN